MNVFFIKNYKKSWHFSFKKNNVDGVVKKDDVIEEPQNTLFDDDDFEDDNYEDIYDDEEFDDYDDEELDTYEERQEFLAEIGLEESGVSRLIRAAYALLNLQTYFTAGEDEVRAWTFMRGSKAPQCAGIIHTDFEKGFIPAEVIKYDDYVTLGGETAVKEAGKMGVEGKEYIVQDGDIMHFRFNV